MTSRRDQVQAYGFMVHRLNSALVHGEPDAAQHPNQRTRGATLGGLALGALGAVGCLLWGVISPVRHAVTAPATAELIVVPQTGASYIYTGGKLRPVLNWSSALLLLNGSTQVQNEPAAAIAGIPEGPPLGIVGAPGALPSSSAVNQGLWLTCAQTANGHPETAVAVGVRTSAAVAVPAGQALVVAVAGAGYGYLIWQRQRLRLDAPWITSALGLGQAPITQVSQTWLNAMPSGPDLKPFSLARVGEPGPVLNGQPTRVGEILTTHNVGSGDALYLVESDGLAPVSATQAALELASPGTAAAYPGTMARPVAVSAPAVAAAPVGRQPLPDGTDVPVTPPSSAAPPTGDVPCIAYLGTGGMSPALLWSTPVGGSPPDVHAPGVSGAATDADLITVAVGGALVQPVTAAGAANGPVYLVTGEGAKFPVPTADELAAFGYQAGRAARLPAVLLGLLPTGPSLNLAPLRE